MGGRAERGGCGFWYHMLKETKNEDSRELDLAVARLYVILTIAVSRKCGRVRGLRLKFQTGKGFGDSHGRIRVIIQA